MDFVKRGLKEGRPETENRKIKMKRRSLAIMQSTAVAQQLPRQVILSSLPRTVKLTPGTYYLYIKDLDEEEGRTVGILLKETL